MSGCSFRLFQVILGLRKIRSCKMKKKLQVNQAKLTVCALLLFSFIGLLLFIRNDCFLYQQTVVRVTDVRETQISNEQDLGRQSEQAVTGMILNGEYKGKIVTYTNVRDDSGAFAMNIKAGDELFVTLDKAHNISGVTDFKRDFYIALITEILVLSLVILGRKKGLRTLTSLLLNVLIFYAILVLRGKGVPVLPLYIIASIIFIVLTLLIISGRNLKTACAIVSSVLSLIVTMVIAFSVIGIYKQSIKELRISGGNIAGDMMGALINVLLFTFMIGTIPMLTLAMANDLPIGLALSYFSKLEIIRSLVGAIGIVLTVPITLYVTILIQKKGEYE